MVLSLGKKPVTYSSGLRTPLYALKRVANTSYPPRRRARSRARQPILYLENCIHAPTHSVVPRLAHAHSRVASLTIWSSALFFL